MSDTVEVSFTGTLGRFAIDAAFAVPAVGVTALFGSSGCGKTSVLRCIAGLTHLPGGRCIVAGDAWQDGASFRPPHERPVGYVFQEASLFPHLSVTGNLLYAARGRRPDGAGGRVGFEEVVALLGLEPLLGRSPRHLSGGERQRVAIGRALLSQPKLLLMDEPLSALDRDTKDEILPFLARLHGALALPVIYVSHDMAEVEWLADHLVLMQAGRVLAAGPLRRLQSDLALPLASARNAGVSLDTIVEAYEAEYGLAQLQVEGARLTAPLPAAKIGQACRIRVAASDVSLTLRPPDSSTIMNVVAARVVSSSEVGRNEIVAVVALGSSGAGVHLLSRLTRKSWESLQLAPGRGVYCQVKSVALVNDGLF